MCVYGGVKLYEWVTLHRVGSVTTQLESWELTGCDQKRYFTNLKAMEVEHFEEKENPWKLCIENLWKIYNRVQIRIFQD